MSFDESVFLAGFIQKTIKVDQIVKLNHVYPQQKLTQKVPEDSRRHHTKAEDEAPPSGVSRPLGPTCHPHIRMSVLHRLNDCIYAVLSSWFDPRAQD